MVSTRYVIVGLTLMTLTLLTSSAILCILYLGELFDTDSEYCSTSGCLIDSSRLLGALNLSAHPCDNFYDFACGNLPVVEDDELEQDIQEREQLELARRLIEKQVKRKTDSSAERKLKDFYKSCTSQSETDMQRLTAVKRFLYSLGGWTSTDPEQIDFGQWNPNSWNMGRTLRTAHYEMNTRIIEMEVIPETVADSVVKPLLKVQAVSRMNTTCDTFGGDVFRNFLSKLSLLLHTTAADTQLFVQGVVNVINYTICKPPSDQFENTMLTAPIEVFLAQTPHLLELREFIRQGYNKVLVDNMTVLWDTDTRAFMHRFSDALVKLGPRNIRDYFAFKFMHDHLFALPRVMQDIFVSFGQTLAYPTCSSSASGLACNTPTAGQACSGPAAGQACYSSAVSRDWRDCLHHHANRVMPLALLALIDNHSENSTINSVVVRTIAQNVHKAIYEQLDYAYYMSEDTRRLVQQRLERKLVVLGGPEFIANQTELDQFYAKLSVSDNKTFLENYLSGKRFLIDVNSRSLDMDLRTYIAFIKNANALRGGAENLAAEGIIIIYPAALSRPLYHHSSIREVNYGGLGFLLAQEYGRDFDGTARSKQWIDLDVRLHEMVEKTDCLRDFISDVKYHGRRLGELVYQYTFHLHQAVADIAGVSWALEAYRMELTGEEDNPENASQLLGLPYQPQQLFFINLVQSICILNPNDRANLRLALRTLSAMRQVPQFADVFYCSKKSAMNLKTEDNRDTGCHIWG